MKKTSIFSLVVAVVVIVGLGIYGFTFTNNDNGGRVDSRNGAYIIDGKTIILKDGISEIEVVPGSASKTITRYMGNGFEYDLDEDGRRDIVFILTQETGGSGTFYYVVAMLNTVEGPLGSYGFLLGDRIIPQSIGVGKNNIIVVNYKDRKRGESFAVSPSVNKNIWLLLDPETMHFGEVVQDFEGEADPNRMKLDMKTWDWMGTIYNNDTKVEPREEKKFTLTFEDGNRFSATTDCNSMMGDYEIKENQIIFGRIGMTKMYCENSQEMDFAKMLGEIQSYYFTTRGELILELKFDSGSMIFK